MSILFMWTVPFAKWLQAATKISKSAGVQQNNASGGMNTFWLACFAVLGWDFLSQLPRTKVIKTQTLCQKPLETCECFTGCCNPFPTSCSYHCSLSSQSSLLPLEATATAALQGRWRSHCQLAPTGTQFGIFSWMLSMHLCKCKISLFTIYSSHVQMYYNYILTYHRDTFKDDAPDAIQVRNQEALMFRNGFGDNPCSKGTSWTTTTLLGKHPDRDPPRFEVLHFGDCSRLLNAMTFGTWHQI